MVTCHVQYRTDIDEWIKYSWTLSHLQDVAEVGW